MKRMKTLGLAILMAFSSGMLLAGEGMWIPLFLKALNENEMQDMGMRISAEDIYSINQACLKDAIVIFGGGCT
ncbi:MAG: S46 family peptidase, partial [Bacteroidales bacterium]|nr:S46 family peptidase [Bacteroidales bacterium]